MASTLWEDISGSVVLHMMVAVGHLVYSYLLDMTSSGDVRWSVSSGMVAMAMVVLPAHGLEVLGVLVWGVGRCDNEGDLMMVDER